MRKFIPPVGPEAVGLDRCESVEMSYLVASLNRVGESHETGPKCPTCGGMSYVLVYGMPAPGSDLTYNRGCIITPGHDPDYVCPHCALEWFELDSGRPVITSFGSNPSAQLRGGELLLLDDLIAAASALPRVGEVGEIVTAAQVAGEKLGLTADESMLLLNYT